MSPIVTPISPHKTRAPTPRIPRRRIAPLRTPQPSLLFKIAPPLHSNLTRIKLAIAAVATLISALLLSFGLSGVAPGEVVEVPVSVGGQDEVPDGQGEQVDQHPDHVGDAVGGDDDEDTRETEDECEEDEGDGGGGGVCDGGFDAQGDWKDVSIRAEWNEGVYTYRRRW